MWIRRKDQPPAPRYRSIDDYDVSDKGSIAWCQYSYLTSKRVTCFIVVDCDQIGRSIESKRPDLDCLHPAVLKNFGHYLTRS